MIDKFMYSIVTLKTLLLALFFCLISAPAQAGSWQQNVSIGGFNSVHIYTPDSDSSIGTGKALLLVLHGCVQPIGNFLTANLEDAAEAHGMVIAVPDAVNKAGFSCWSYWQGAINRNSGDYANLISLANTLSNDSARTIDPDQVYISGLSSGAAFAAQAACVAPDVFAGVAPSAGPTIGTSSNGAISSCESVSAATFKSRCESYAG
ncbi:MAG: poly(hydroxyalkanoate) depolymerase family esterase, partial [Paracoccaceae bacterium]